MDLFRGFVIEELIRETPSTSMYKARKDGTGEAVVIKALRTDTSRRAEMARFRHEYELIRSNWFDGLVRVHDVIDWEGGVALVLEDFGGEPLTKTIQGGLPLEQFLGYAIRIAGIVGKIHSKNITHRDIKPAAILVNLSGDALKLTDFGAASELTPRNGVGDTSRYIEGTLEYMSPEQTGRMNRAVDYRTDLYSLGVTFYEMLTGGVPFMSRDPREIIHAHIAKEPVPPDALNPGVPAPVSALVMRLMAKAAEDRYQNGFGVMADLETCRDGLSTSGAIQPFDLGKRDISPRLNTPQVLEGRNSQVALLLQAFERARNGSVEVMLVTGAPGIGKSALVNEIQVPVAEERGFFISGKYNQLRKNIPHSAIVQAFQGLARELLAESEGRVQEWKKKILRTAGPNGKIVTDAVPEMELILGSQPDLPQVGFEETRNRFNHVFQGFVRTFADKEHPLVLFLDDLQWADSASLDLIQTITTDRALSHFLLIGAYREDEVTAHHPLSLALESIRNEGVGVERLSLDVLRKEDVNRLLVGLLKCGPDMSAPLAGIIVDKTLGNPFFVIQFLKTLYEEKYLAVDEASGWRWDSKTIRGMQVTDNVVDLMAGKIARLPGALQEVLQVCACIGNRFDLETLSILLNQSLEATLSSLDELIRRGLIDYRGTMYRFHHDRIQEAAYSLVPAHERENLHRRIGRRLLETTPPEQLVNWIFFITDQFNQALSLIDTREEKDTVAELNLKAGLRAKEAMAHPAAAGYLRVAKGILPEKAWDEQYSLAYAINLELMGSEYLSLNFREAERLFPEILRNARTKVDRARAYSTMVRLSTSAGKLSEAIDLGVKGLRMFGLRLSPKAGRLDVMRELIGLRVRLRRVGIDKVIGLPPMSDEEKIWVTELAVSTGTPAYFTNPLLFSIIVLKTTRMSLAHGLSPFAGSGFLCAALLIGSVLGEYRLAYRIGELALEVDEKIGAAKADVGRDHFLFGSVVLHWVRPLRDSLAYLYKANKLCLEVGDFYYSGFGINLAGLYRMILGDPIDDILEELARFKDFIEKTRVPFLTLGHRQVTHFCLNLKGQTESLFSLNTKEKNADESLAEARRKGSLNSVFTSLLPREQIHYLYGDYGEACRIGDELDTLLGYVQGTAFVPEHLFYRCLSLMAVYPAKAPAEKRRILSLVGGHQRKMKRWAENAPANYLHKYLLVQAEVQAVTGRFQEAAEMYHKAIQSARENGYTQNEAIANERAALFYLGRGFGEIGEAYMKAAYQAYERWGALSKMRELERAHDPILGKNEELTPAGDAPSTGTAGTGISSTLLDLSTVIQLTRRISGEIVPEKLLEEIMRLAVVHSGAQRAFFLSDTDGKLTIEASLEEGKEDVPLMQSLPLEGSEKVSTGIVNYVHRSGQYVILGDALREGTFRNDSHVIRNRCRSILCMPVQSKGRPTGVFYLENNLVANAFTPGRVELLRVISAQAAISLENARLFEMATTDGLTGLIVPRYFHHLLDQEIQRCLRYGRTFSVAMMDGDDFKRLNDTHGHQAGDEVLRSIAWTLKKNCRGGDVVARYGGEEFILILPETSMNDARLAAEKFRRLVEETDVLYDSDTLHATISVGVAAFPLHAKDKQSLIQSADAALYASKRSGKNRVSAGGKVN